MHAASVAAPPPVYIGAFTATVTQDATGGGTGEVTWTYLADAADLVEAEVVRYPSFDKLQIPALLYKPHDASKTNRLPAIVEVQVHQGTGDVAERSPRPAVVQAAKKTAAGHLADRSQI